MVDLASLRCIHRYCLNVKAKTKAGKEYLKPSATGFCEANGRECVGRAVGLFADAAGHGIQLCAQHEAEYVKNPTPEGDETR